jgi:hypothetical protein
MMQTNVHKYAEISSCTQHICVYFWYHNARAMDHTNLKIFFYRLMQLLSTKYAAFVFKVVLKV